MKKLLLAIIVLFLLSGCEYGGSEPDVSPYDYTELDSISFVKDGNETKVLILGDSTMYKGETWNYLPYTVYNAGMGTTTTIGVLNRMHLIDTVDPDIVIVGAGMNDVFHGHNIVDIQARFLEIKEICKSKNVPVVFIEVSDPYNVSSGIVSMINNFVNENTIQVPFDCQNDETTDGIHFTDSGYKRLSKSIENTINNI
jgi:lysophospholipase L1-like esterase